MPRRARSLARVTVAILAAGLTVSAHAADIGQIKVATGQVAVERGGQILPGTVGLRLQRSDVIRTGVDGSIGVTMSDNSLLSAGPNSVLSLDVYSFDTTTHQGRFETSLRKGSLAVSSGSIAKQSPDAMKVRTPAAILGVRGTDFVVSVDD